METRHPLPRSARRALVTGGTGFIGSHLVHALASEDWEVHVLCRQTRPDTERVTFHLIPATRPSLVPILETIRPDIVFHLATCFLPEHRTQDIPDLVEANILFGTQLLEAMAAAQVKNLVNAGSHWQHALPDRPELHPTSLYAATKNAFEAILDYYCQIFGLNAISLTLFDSYGPGDTRPKLLNKLISQPKHAPTLDLSPGEQRLNLVHVHDVVAAFSRCADLLRISSSGHHHYMLSGIQPHSLREIVEMLERLADRKFNIAWGARPYRTHEIMEPWRAGPPLPGWQPAISLERGLSDLLRDSERSA